MGHPYDSGSGVLVGFLERLHLEAILHGRAHGLLDEEMRGGARKRRGDDIEVREVWRGDDYCIDAQYLALHVARVSSRGAGVHTGMAREPAMLSRHRGVTARSQLDLHVIKQSFDRAE